MRAQIPLSSVVVVVVAAAAAVNEICFCSFLTRTVVKYGETRDNKSSEPLT